MKTAAVVLLLALVKVRTETSGGCEMVGFYKELGCSPSAQNRSGCPDFFSCPDLHPDKSKCYYRGTAYNDNAKLPSEVIKNPCSVACYCKVREHGAQFECAAVDCFDAVDANNEECIKTFSLDKCCSTGQVCGKDATEKLSSCEIEGKMYKEGQLFEPEGTFKTCVCAPQWDRLSSLDDPKFCRDVNCGLEIHHQDSIMNNCAPVFFANARSCPIDFQCPTPRTRIIRKDNSREVAEKCVFGNETLSMGDEIVIDEGTMKCTCDVPPYVSCIKSS